MSTTQSGANPDPVPSTSERREGRPTPGQNQSSQQQRQNNDRRSNSNARRTSTAFKGATEGMNGNMFQVPSEQPPRNQFQRTLEELEIFAASKYSKEIDLFASMFNNLQYPIVPKPAPLPPNADAIDQAGFQEEVELWKKDERTLKSTLRSLYGIVWGQCSPLMQTRVKKGENYETHKMNGDVVWLLKEIKIISHQFESHIICYEALDEAQMRLSKYLKKD